MYAEFGSHTGNSDTIAKWCGIRIGTGCRSPSFSKWGHLIKFTKQICLVSLENVLSVPPGLVTAVWGEIFQIRGQSTLKKIENQLIGKDLIIPHDLSVNVNKKMFVIDI